jgi:hypothetical protein
VWFVGWGVAVGGVFLIFDVFLLFLFAATGQQPAVHFMYMYIHTLYRHNVQHVRLVQYDHTVAVLYVCPVVLYIVCTVHGLPACTVHYVVCCIYSYSYSYSIYFVAYILCKHCLCIVKNCMCCIALPARLYLCSYTVCTSTLLNRNRGVLRVEVTIVVWTGSRCCVKNAKQQVNCEKNRKSIPSLSFFSAMRKSGRRLWLT